MTLGDRRILMVTGKGGVGKTTVATAIGLEAARRGLRTVIAETSGSQRIPELFGLRSKGYALLQLQDQLFTLSITPQEAMEDYVVQQVKIRKIYEMVFKNRVMGPFIEAVPGLHDAVQLGKIFDLARAESRGRADWDLIVVDAPATGHGLSLLSSARTMMDLTRSGPLFEGVRQVHDVVDDPKVSGVVLVSLPEEMPVNETAELYARLGVAQERVKLVVLNDVRQAPFPPGPDWPAARAALLADAPPDRVEAVALTDRWLERVARQDRAREALRSRVGRPQADLPHIDGGQPNLADLSSLGLQLGEALDRAGGAPR